MRISCKGSFSTVLYVFCYLENEFYVFSSNSTHGRLHSWVSIEEACIGWYQVSHIPGSKQASIPYKLGNIPIIDFPKYQYPWK